MELTLLSIDFPAPPTLTLELELELELNAPLDIAFYLLARFSLGLSAEEAESCLPTRLPADGRDPEVP